MNTTPIRYYIENKLDGNRVFPGFYTYFETIEEAEEAASRIFRELPGRFTIKTTSR
jgi:hypothetical protein